jgi:3-phytase
MRIPTSAPRRALLPTAFLAFLACLPAGCATAPARPAITEADATAVRVAEAYVSAPQPGEELDSMATWRAPDGAQWLIATAKSMHRLVVFDADTGARLRDVGGKGTDDGRFRRPNGIAVAGDRVFVVERDNHRVQVLSLPDFRPLGTFGQGELRSPYGLWLAPAADGAVDLFVTDNYMLGEHFDIVPPLDTLDHRVQRYRVRFDGDGHPAAAPVARFGATTEAEALKVVESIAGDPANDRLMIADESLPHSTLREYTFAGRPTGRRIPGEPFTYEAEGVALWICRGAGADRDARGYWVAVDQSSERTVFHLFDRRTLKRVGSLHGDTVAATDGIALRTEASPRFPHGALFVMHDDVSVAAFDLHAIATALKLDPRCF